MNPIGSAWEGVDDLLKVERGSVVALTMLLTITKINNSSYCGDGFLPDCYIVSS